MKNVPLFLLGFLYSCSSIQKIDLPVCVGINMNKGFCTTIISGKDQIVDDSNLLDGKTWFETKHEMVLVPVKTWSALKTYLITECKRSNRCGRNIQTWESSIQNLDLKIERRKAEFQRQDSPFSSEDPSSSNTIGK